MTLIPSVSRYDACARLRRPSGHVTTMFETDMRADVLLTCSAVSQAECHNPTGPKAHYFCMNLRFWRREGVCCGYLVCDGMWTCRSVPVFLRNMLPFSLVLSDSKQDSHFWEWSVRSASKKFLKFLWNTVFTRSYRRSFRKPYESNLHSQT
jgi:hypothetical protein